MSKAAANLSVDPVLKNEVKSFVLKNPRAGRRDLSELTETLWIKFLRGKGVQLPERFAFKPSAKRRSPKMSLQKRRNGA